MGLFSKKDKIPEIPPAPEVPRIISAEQFKSIESIPAISTLPTLPKKPVESLPSLPALQGDGRDQLNRQVIKSAIEDSSEKIKGDTSGATMGSMKGLEESTLQGGIPVLSSMKLEKEVKPQPLDFSNREELIKSQRVEFVPAPPMRLEIPRSELMPVEPEHKNIVKKDAEETIFVRIDKYSSAKRDAQEISRDLKEIEEVLNKIEQIKLKEDEEITEITKVMDEIKLRMTRIDNDVFNRI